MVSLHNIGLVALAAVRVLIGYGLAAFLLSVMVVIWSLQRR